MLSRVLRLVGATGATLSVLGAVATAVGPPPPTTPSGTPAQQFAAGLSTPTAFAFGAGQVFAGDAGSQDQKTPGGVFLLSHGTAARLPGSPPVVFGLTWRGHTLYVSALNKILAWSGWNGSSFSKHKVLFTAPKRFTGFNGLAFGANGRLYAGVALPQSNDHSPSKAPYAFDVVSLTETGRDLKVVASGIRQPWQLAFPGGSSSPFVSNFGQDAAAKNPPDFLLRVRQGQDYGFPKCNWVKAGPCKPYAKPVKFFAPHTDVGGLAIMGSSLYMSEFGFAAQHGGPPALVVSMPLHGGPVKTVLKGSWRRLSVSELTVATSTLVS